MPLNRIEQYLGNLRGDGNTIPDKPLNRIEKYLAIMCGEDYEIPKPLNRIEQYLADIAENGGGGGGGGGETVIVPEQTVEAIESSGLYQADIGATWGIVPGLTYVVGYDGVDYELVATMLMGAPVLGEGNDQGPDFTNYPFVFMDVGADYLRLYASTGGEHTVKITLMGGSSATIIEKSITANGDYDASSDSADGYNPVHVSVPNTYTAGDEGKVVSSGALVTQTAATYTANSVYDTTLIDEVTVNVSGGGGGGLEYETGTFTPTEDIARPTITFANTHTVGPLSIIMIDVTGTDAVADSNLCWEFFDYRKLDPAGVNFGGSTTYGYVYWNVRTSSSFTGSEQRFTTGTDSSTSSSPYYWAKETAFSPYVNTASRFWRAGRTYKWIAVWAPSA